MSLIAMIDMMVVIAVIVTSRHCRFYNRYTRWGYAQLIDAGVQLLQPDVMWMGGPTEFARVVALAAAKVWGRTPK